MLGHEEEFDYNAPTLIPPPRLVSDWPSIDKALEDNLSFTSPWEAKLRSLEGAQTISTKTESILANDMSLVDAIGLSSAEFLGKVSHFIEQRTLEAIHANSQKTNTYVEIDVVNGVANTAWTQAAACLTGIPLRSPSDSQPFFESGKLHSKLAALFQCIFSFSMLDAKQELSLRREAIQANKELREVVGEVCDGIKCSSESQSLQRNHGDNADATLTGYGYELLRRLLDDGKSIEELVSVVILLAVQIVTPSVFAVSSSFRLLGFTFWDANFFRLFASSICSCQSDTRVTGSEFSSFRVTWPLGPQQPCEYMSWRRCVFYRLPRLASARQRPALVSMTGAILERSSRATRYCSTSLLQVATGRDFQMQSP